MPVMEESDDHSSPPPLEPARTEPAGFDVAGRRVTVEDYRRMLVDIGICQGDDPLPHPRDLADPLAAALFDAAAHDESCPAWCEECDQWEKPRSCGNCRGSGCLPNSALAYLECGHCAGDGRDHRPYTPTGTWRGEPLPGDPEAATDAVDAGTAGSVR